MANLIITPDKWVSQSNKKLFFFQALHFPFLPFSPISYQTFLDPFLSFKAILCIINPKKKPKILTFVILFNIFMIILFGS